ncbi:MAG: nuclear transport factor 2 family protein [Caulobacter sp.]|nr:nuclear transport factor 2 family protein [Caulobacter sp.]
MIIRLIAAALATVLGAPALAAPAATAPVVAAERAFAADGLALGAKAAFLKHSAANAIVIQPDPVNAHQALSAQPDGPKGPPLVWWPVWAGISRGGDLGFTSGPYTVDGKPGGHYFTVWKKQPDGGWKWIFDGGAGADGKDEPVQGSEPVSLPLATGAAASPAAALAEVTAREANLAAWAKTDQKAAFLADLAQDGRLYVAPLPPAKDRAAFETALAAWPATFDMAQLGGEAAASADLVWTYGSARWTRGDQARRGHYVHVWQHRTGGWRLVFAEIIPAPAAATSPAVG